MTPTPHDLMRKAMLDHGITAREIVELLERETGADRQNIEAAVRRFIDGAPGCIGIHAAIIELSVVAEQAIRH